MHLRGVRTKFTAQRVTFVSRDFGFGNKLRHLITDSSSQIPHVTVALRANNSKHWKKKLFVAFNAELICVYVRTNMIQTKWDMDTYGAVDSSHVASIGVNMHRVDRHLWLWDELLVMVCFKIPDVDHTTLISNKQFSLKKQKKTHTHQINSYPMTQEPISQPSVLLTQIWSTNLTWLGWRHTQLMGALTWNILWHCKFLDLNENVT